MSSRQDFEVSAEMANVGPTNESRWKTVFSNRLFKVIFYTVAILLFIVVVANYPPTAFFVIILVLARYVRKIMQV
ncbi:MAG: hypothetical protein IH840_08110 [Candidatus Heimdallarchaeota archaeon]|nr:hypothetical protein [Candidatus Heimdallarchaeota archaeon]